MCTMRNAGASGRWVVAGAVVLTLLGSCKSQSAGIQALIARVAGQQASDLVRLETILVPDGQADAYEVSGGGLGGPVLIRGTSPVAMASGFRRYLRDAANCSVSWAGSQLYGLIRTAANGSSYLPAVRDAPGAEASRPTDGVLAASTNMTWRQWGNVVVHSYTAAFWNESRWEQQLDLMAMRGYNLALAFTGQEAIWASVFMSLGLSEKDLAPFFTGPAFLAWGGPRMGNARGWQGPLPPAWRNGQIALGQQLVRRMRELGIVPAFPMFAGHVPLALASLFPDANITNTGQWAGFNCTYSCVGLLQPQTPLFDRIVTATVKAIKAVYGDLITVGQPRYGSPPTVFDGPVTGAIDHVWQFDTYNELLPASNSSAFLSALSNATYAPLADADPGAIWMLQGWMFSFSESFWVPRAVQAYIDGVSPGRLLILDLDAYLEPIWRTTDRFYGAPFLWGVINDGGQRPGLFGNFSRILTGPAEAAASNMLGISFAPEGLFVNPVLFELLADVVWGDIPRAPSGEHDLDAWLVRCITARYGLDLPATSMEPGIRKGAEELHAATRTVATEDDRAPLASREASLLLVSAWRHLAVAVYNHTAEQSGSLVENIPSIGDGPGYGWCDTQELAAAWRDMSQALGIALAPGSMAPSPLLVFDGADVVRQVAVNSVEELAGMLAGATNRSDSASVAGIAAAISTLLDSFNTTLSAHPDFATATWAQSARDMCTAYGGEELAEHCVENALWQITLWGALEARDSGANLDTYAAKQWSGAASALYKQRWGIVLAEAAAAAAAKRPPDNNAIVEAQVNATALWATDATHVFDAVEVTPGLVLEGNGPVYAGFGGNPVTFLQSFDVYMDSDADGEIMPTTLATRDVGQMAAFCLTDPNCGGFNANGWLKAIGAPRVPFPGSTLWVRKQH